jgi:hypothetical protein
VPSKDGAVWQFRRCFAIHNPLQDRQSRSESLPAIGLTRSGGGSLMWANSLPAHHRVDKGFAVHRAAHGGEKIFAGSVLSR